MNNENNFNGEQYGTENTGYENMTAPSYDSEDTFVEPAQPQAPEQTAKQEPTPDISPIYNHEQKDIYSSYEAENVYTAASRESVYNTPSHHDNVSVPEEAPVQNVYKDNSPNLMKGNSFEQNGFNPYAPRDPQVQQTYQYNPQPTYNNMPPSGNGSNGKNGGMKVAIGVIAACVVVAVLVIIISFGGSSGKQDVPTTASGSITSDSAATTAPSAPSDSGVAVQTTSPQNVSNGAVWIADKVRPSVVGVMVYEGGQLAGEGSGVLMSEKDGFTYVVTCAHVVEADGVTYGVLLLDGTRYEAQLVAADTRTDIAVLKVEKTGLPLAEFGDSTSLKVGETIYAIGNPGGSEYFGSITDGIVSAIDRSITATYTMTCIQHNAAINPGNSGGALVNSQGQVIGINSSKIASTEFEGMGFAVPTSIAKPVVDALIQHGYVPNRPKLGIEYAPVSSYQLYSMVVSIKGLPKDSLVIAGISEDSSLVNTDAEVGDLIIAVNGKKMDDSSVLLDLIDTGAVGDTLTLTLCRIESRTYKTTNFDVTITLVEDKGNKEEQSTTTPEAHDGYYYGGSESFEDFFNDYFGEFGW